MIFEPWLLVHAAELADQTVAHLAATASSLHHEVHMLLEDITDQAGWVPESGVNGGCTET